jgi:hypothetical protein
VPKKPRWRSYCERLVVDLEAVEALMMELLDASTIVHSDPNRYAHSGVAVIAPTTRWGRSDEKQTRLQMRGTAAYDEWFIRFRLLFRSPTPRLRDSMKEADKFVRAWFERGGSDWGVPSEMSAAKEKAQGKFEELRSILRLACGEEEQGPAIVAVPDTNALIDVADLASYAGPLGQATYDVRLVPTVLGEIDDLKRSGRVQDLRDAARRVDRMLKGLRDRGDVRAGVRVTKSVSVVFEVAEPTFEGLPGWLDPKVPDDRFVASALLLQSSMPTKAVVIVTSDLNVENKVAAVGLPHVEPPVP